MAYKGYHFKLIKGSSYWIIPNSCFICSGIRGTPQIIQDSDAYRDGTGFLHRDSLSHKSAKFVVTLCPMYQSDLDEFFEKLNDYIIDSSERKVDMEFYNEFARSYERGYFYIADPEFKTLAETDSGILYDSTQLHLIRY